MATMQTIRVAPGIIKRGDKQFRAQLMLGGARYGKTFSSLRRAKDWLEDTRADYRAGRLRNVTEGLKSWSVGDCVSFYVRKHLSGVSGNHGHLSAIERYKLLPFTLDKISKRHVRRWRDKMLDDGLAPATVVKRLDLLAAIFNFVLGNTDLEFENPASSKAVKRPRGADVKRNRRLVDDEEARLFNELKKSSYPDDSLLTRFAIAQATRLSEAVNLTWGCVDLKRRTIALHSTKNEAHRTERGPEIRPLSSGAVAVLQEKLDSLRKKPRSSDHVFYVGTSSSFSVRFGRISRAAGLTDFRFHDLRHEATSRLAKLLPNSLDLKRVTGHMDLKSLDRYYQPDPSDIAARI